MAELEELLQERGRTHGSFATNALLSQHMKMLFRSAPGWNGLSDIHKESLEMIALKISRILSGQAQFEDHWDDVAGYARLGAKG
jgi:Domain of unknown function (DUF6378)